MAKSEKDENIVKENFRMRKSPELVRFFELMSALQKTIRWCEVNDARFFAKELIEMGKPGTNFTRLKVIAAEDIGLADPTLLKYVWECSDEFEIMLKKYNLKKSQISDSPETCAIIDRAVIAAALSNKSRLLAMLTFATLFDIYKNEDFNQGLDEYKKQFQTAIQRQDEKNAAYYAYVVGIFLKSENSLLEIVRQESKTRNTELIDEWSREYRRTKKEDKFLILAGIISLLCRELDQHGEYRDHVSEWLSLPIDEAVIPDRAFDMHTDAGREKGRGFKHFFDEAATIRNERFPNDWEEQGKEAYFQAQREGLEESEVIEAIKKKCHDYGGQEILKF